GIFAIVRGPDGEVAGPGDAALGSLPEEFGIGMFGKFVEADIAAVNGHGVGVGGEGDNAGAVVVFDVADFDLFSEGGGPAIGVEAADLHVVFAMADDGAGEVENIGEVENEPHIFEGTGV